MALTQPKKPVGGGYGVFLGENRAEFLKKVGKPTAVSKMGSEEWKKLSDAQKAPYTKKYEEAKAEYEKGMAAFLASGGEKQKGAAALRSEKRKAKDGKKKKKEKDPNAPKKPAGGGYGVFLSENRASIVTSLPAGHKITDVAKAAGGQWKAMSAATKKPFEEKYEKKKAEYAAALEEYKKTHGVEAEAEDEEEEDEEEEPATKKGKNGGA